MNHKITQTELVEMFGVSIPMRAAVLLWDNPAKLSIVDLRVELRKMAIPQTHLSDGWQDIASAPATTDHMRPILANWRGRGVQQTYWDVDDDFRDRPKGWRSPESGWRCDGDQCIPVNQEDVTHWMPRPAPPLTNDKGAGA